MQAKVSLKQRRQGIVDWVNEHGHTSVDALAEMFNTSVVTIRKDVVALAASESLIRQFGGAAPFPLITSKNEETSTVSSSAQQRAIGKMAASQLFNGARIVIDSGSTTATMLPFIRGVNNLVVMTNALNVASHLTKNKDEPTVLMSGGTWDPQSQSFQGAMAEQLVSNYSFDLAFIGAAGIDVNRGTTTLNETFGLSRTMASGAAKVVIMAASSKLAYKMPNLELGWKQVSMLITDSGISKQDKQIIENQGVTVLVATPSGE